ncbi:D-isomer specific 2-hydroxyacid dehydrogenase, putative [Phytophthora infestans T30-4]|uniref:D-isomer specific 2-hydroxyacid dehydrogenase, putative n=2 Tax=Phytophthora infestans TaxID=4787 RepID=D0NSU0_PHYIT|nr:D-isomer specific 2-hydroxyacid dehydrogenase, putative [Phytophthora infestans T30-4]EEY64652.1 D-isomer specific 2-hydroxyacid dehydrogenase, putative [Phytophthora infestans T30-4]KAF4039247.1 D-isomer specific 2-hydroxyacid dehydrogenase NAD binding domain [Phytophthora infestans]KAF4127237.1 D-isomer specific 2-hydroxyacid dehydrogenase NAD binding domain-containing protein [Phytophthora infestans]KAF4138385.1 D-isomer specific 2-hydroxyacid dehydrogenase NAD binding domain-containing p|eukprot:XP_002897852.1 D-isomer specific 2-hydroxyacid dehydrogenase, putative [Phytophthora infestans T30-4]
MPAVSKLRVPVVSFLNGMGSAMRKQFAASTTPAGDLFRSGKLELVDIPVPTLVGNAQNPLNGHNMDDSNAPKWDLTIDQQRAVEQARIVVMDQHSGGPLFLAPHENLPKDKHHLLRNIEWVQGTYAGVEQYLNRLPHGANALHSDQLPKFTLTRAGGFLPRIMAQYVFGYVTMLERMLLEARDFQINRDYAREQLIQFRPAQNVTIGILGLGDIGQGVGRMLRAAGYKVLGFKRRIGSELDQELADCADRITPNLDEVLFTSDYLVNVLPSTSSTRFLLTEKKLELCRERKPVFINIGRGDVIAEKTIIRALDSGVWSRAVLDVFEKEPLPRESALWSHPSVLLTPHISGYVFVDDVASLFVDNLNRYLRGDSVLYKVDWTAGY